MNVLSLFDGMSCGQIALRELGIKVDRYYASEINKHAIKQTQLNFPDTIQLGDVRDVRAKDLPKIDLLIGGSPCQGFSFAGKQLNFNDPRSALFFEFVRILNECREINPGVRFMLENVRMKREYEQVISDTLGLKPVMINSALVSAQNRVRLYWSNIRTASDGLFEVKTDIPQPEDRGLFLRDILEDDVDEKYYLSHRQFGWLQQHSDKTGNPFKLLTGENKTRCLTATAQVNVNLSADYILVDTTGKPRKNQDKASCLTVGGHGAGNHSDMDILIIQRHRGNNKGGTFTDKSPTLSANAWEHNNILCISSKQAHATVSVNKSTPMVAAMGMGGGHVPMIVKREVRQLNPCSESGGKQPYQQNRVYDADGIMPSLCSAHAGHAPLVACDEIVRRITPTEASRLQTIPDWYKWECSATQQYTMLGNGWTVEVIKHIFSFL